MGGANIQMMIGAALFVAMEIVIVALAKEKRQSMEKDNADAAVKWFGKLVRNLDNALEAGDLDSAIDYLQKLIVWKEKLKRHSMTKEQAIEQANGYQKWAEKIWRTLDDIDFHHPEYPMPMEMLARVKAEKGVAESFLFDHGIKDIKGR